MKIIKKCLFSLIIFLCLFLININFAEAKKIKVRYKTQFENCPSQVLGRLTLKLIRYFEKDSSLYSVKKKIIDERLSEIYYLEDYKIRYNPLKKMLYFYFKCPIPSFKLEVINNGETTGQEGVLARSGVVLSNGYLSLLRTEGKFKKELPIITIMNDDFERELKNATAAGNLFMSYFAKELSELVINEDGNLTAILSVQNSPVTVFMGKGEWSEKIVKLKKTVTYLDRKTRLPKVVNITDVKKVVVKFSDNN